MRRWALAPLCALAACSGPSDRVAVEDLGDVDLRVVVARAGAQAEARVLRIEAPYRFEVEPLADVFGRGDNLRIWVLGFKLETITAAFPALADRGLDDVITRLQPALGAPGPGRYAAPTPDAVLFATVTEDSPEDVAYGAKAWGDVAADVALNFALPGDQACPPVGVVVRAFLREDPSRACIYTRKDTCEWARPAADRCPDEARVFGASGTIVQRPDGALDVGATQCSPVEAEDGGGRRGETRAYRCGDHLVGVQEQPRDALGSPWLPVRGPSVNDPALELPGAWAPVAPGAYFGASDAGVVTLRRLAVSNGQATLQTLQHVVVDRPAADRAASSPDGVTVTLADGAFEDSVGTAAQCFRLLAGERPLAWAELQQLEAPNRLRLGPGLSPFNPTQAWDIIGDPGQIQAANPDVLPVRLPAAAGSFVALSARPEPAQLFVQATQRAYLFAPLTRLPGERGYLQCPTEVPLPVGALGGLVAGPNQLYALTQSGLQLLTPAGAAVANISADGETFTSAWTLTRVTTRRSQERVIAYREDIAHLFDPDQRRHDRVQLPGRILAVLPGPDLLYRTQTEPFALYRVELDGGQPTNTIRYVIPPFEEGAADPPSLDQSAVIAPRTQPRATFSAGSLAGVLDLDTGLSTAIGVAFGAQIEVVFEDDTGTETWAGVSSAVGPMQLVRFPSL